MKKKKLFYRIVGGFQKLYLILQSASAQTIKTDGNDATGGDMRVEMEADAQFQISIEIKLK